MKIMKDVRDPHSLRCWAKDARAFLILKCVILAMAVGPVCAAQDQTVVLDGDSKGRIYDGIGAVSAGASSRLLIDYPEPQRSQILDYLFKPGYGAALQHLKVEVGADVNSTDGAEPSHMRSRDEHNFTRGYEWWLMTEARKRNPSIVLDTLPWGAPGWVGNGKFYSPDMAGYIADFLRGADSQHHLDIAYTGVWNEKVYDPQYVKELHQALMNNHLSTKIVCCDEYPRQGSGEWAIADAIHSDTDLNTAIAAIGVHYPLVSGKITTTEAARQSGKPLWSSEDQPNGGGGPFVSRDWAVGGRILAHLYNRNYLEGALTQTQIWSPVTSYYDILAAPNSGLMYANTPWSGYYDVQGTIWATAHTTQFVQPGWQYLDTSSGNLPEKGTFVTMKSPHQGEWSVVLETIDAKHPQRVNFQLTGGLAKTAIHVWETNSKKTFERVADISSVDSKFIFTFDPDSLYSLTTTTGQGKGSATPPAQHAFPMPYSDDFEQTALNKTPKYLSDQDGAFEVHECISRQGKCLEQMIQAKPIPWGPLPDPFTLAGDATQRDYRIEADVMLIGSGAVTVMGRIDSADVFQDGKAIWPSGYILSIQADGKWTLSSASYKKETMSLGTGTTASAAKKWHHVSLRFQGTKITAKLDGIVLTSVDDGSHPQGMFALGTGWNRVQFDNLRVAN